MTVSPTAIAQGYGAAKAKQDSLSREDQSEEGAKLDRRATEVSFLKEVAPPPPPPPPRACPPCQSLLEWAVC